MTTFQYEPVGESAAELADWIETILLAEQRRGASRAELTRRVAGHLGRDENDEEFVSQIELALREIDDRRRRVGAAYPFTYAGRRVDRVDSVAEVPYFFMVLAARPTEEREEARSQAAALLLDLVAADVLRRYLGDGSESIRFGMPPTPPRPQAFADAVPWLAGQMAVDTRVSPNFIPNQMQDSGADVVAWKRIGNAMDGFLVILAQCTISANWQLKRRDAIPERWSGWLNTLWPSTAMVVPFVVRSESSEWEYIRGSVSMLLDRLTVTALLQDQPAIDQATLRAWIEEDLEHARIDPLHN